MLFAHLADCHIGGWRDARMSDASTMAFKEAVDLCIGRQVDFVLISGDLFNTSLPTIECLKETVMRLKELANLNIPVYVVAGSHDYSPTGKTMLDVLEGAGLFVNVARPGFTVDEKTGVKLAGLFGRKGALERDDYRTIDRLQLENEGGFKIFLLHSAVEGLNADGVVYSDSLPSAMLPGNFDYYAAGHVHAVVNMAFGRGVIAYPGPLFPNNFNEIEGLQNGGFYFVETLDGKVALEWQPVLVHNVHPIAVDCNGKTPEQVEKELLEQVNTHEFNNTIVTLRLSGTLKVGKPSDISFKRVFDEIYLRSAHFVMKNTSALKSREYEDVKVEQASVEGIEEKLIVESKKLGIAHEEELSRQLIGLLDIEKQEGETTSAFEQRVREQVSKVLNI